jgi:hypothetical protein
MSLAAAMSLPAGMPLALLDNGLVIRRNFSLNKTCGIGAVLPVELYGKITAVPFAYFKISYIYYLELTWWAIGWLSFE